MHRIALVLALLTVLALQTTPVGAAASLDRPTFTCGAGSATMSFTWRPASDASVQYIDVSLADNGFAPGTFISAGPFDAGVTSYSWPGVRPNVRHYFRVNTLTPNGWQSTADTFSAPCRPSEASVGGRDAPFTLYAGVYVLDLTTGAVRRINDARGNTEIYSPDRTFDWSPDGTRIAVVKGAAAGGLQVFDTAGLLKSEVKETATNVKWLSGDTLASRMLSPGNIGQEGYGIVNAATGAVDSFIQGPTHGTWSPDGRRLAYFRHGQGLYVRNLASGEDRLVRAGEFGSIAWSPDGTRIATGFSTTDSMVFGIIDASTGAELVRLDRPGNDATWFSDGRSLAMSGWSGETPEVLLLSADGSPTRSIAKGTRPMWSPDGTAVTYLRDGELWYTSLSDGVASPLLRPQLPVIQEQRWSPAGNMIAFRTGGYGSIYVARADGTDERYIAPGGTPAWSPKGDRLSFLFSGGAGFRVGGSVYTATPQGVGFNFLGSTWSSDAISPCWLGSRYVWSPDGSSIAYWTQDSGQQSDSLFVVRDAQGAKPELVAKANSPTWSPDGKRLAFTVPTLGGMPAPGQTPTICDVAVSAADGTGTTVIARGVKSPLWSPDGAFLAVDTVGFAPGQIKTRVVAADGSGQRGEFTGYNAVWSPDGKQLAYTISSWTGGAIPPPHTPLQIVVSNLDGSAPRLIAEGSTGRFDWSPDGTRIVYSRVDLNVPKLHVFDLTTGVSKAIGTGQTPVFSPDGEWIAFSR